ncbi:xylulokinase [Sporosarcina cascadiensis]|uniref:xylulokinase n=1 Tax=Sporosarcina cascadiensis TaxID=2660747 RepID=UPI00129AC5E2|nr:xylulokinase [Sporosarcina cascadiensis]
MRYVIGIDLGTSSVKLLLVDQNGLVCNEVSKDYPLIHKQSGYSEQNPDLWVEKTIEALRELLQQFKGDSQQIEGMSFSGQMHGLVLVDQEGKLLRNAILWNDTRTTEQCEEIYEMAGKERILMLAKNPALEGFTLPKLLWVKEHEPEIYRQIAHFMLPKDYLRYRLTGTISSELSDAAGTLLLDISKKIWSKEICESVGVDLAICPPLVKSDSFIGNITDEIAQRTGLPVTAKVFAGGADNACGAVGAGILKDGMTLCSIGTSGVILSYETASGKDYEGRVHYFNHAKENAYYAMGVTLSAGHSLDWYRRIFAGSRSFQELLSGIEGVPAGANGLLFTPYLVGERTPHADSNIRASFIGMDTSHSLPDFTRAILEGITFSLNESLSILRDSGKSITSIVSIGGGAKNSAWLQMQADIFDAEVSKLANEQGPGMGAAMLAAVGCGWFHSLEECAEVFIKTSEVYRPNEENVRKYKELFAIYQQVYSQTKSINDQLAAYRN